MSDKKNNQTAVTANEEALEANSVEHIDSKEQQVLENLEKEEKTINEQAVALKKQEETIKNVNGQNTTSTVNNNPSDQTNQKTMTDMANNQIVNQEYIEVRALKTRVNLLTLLLCLTIGAGAYGAYYFNQHKYDDINQVFGKIEESRKAVEDTHTAVGDLYTKILSKDARIDEVFNNNNDIRAQNNAIRSNEEKLTKQVAQAKELTEKVNLRLNQYEARNPEDWLIAQSYFLVANAENIMSFSDNLEAARLNLEQADLLLVKITDPKISRLREAIVKDSLLLKSIPDIDQNGMVFKLNAIYDSINKMPLNEFLDSKLKEDIFAKKDVDSSDLKNWKENLKASVANFSKRFIEIRRRDESMVNQFLSPEQTKILLKNLQTEIILLKVALSNQDEIAFRSGLQELASHIRSYFDCNSEIVKTNLEIINELDNASIRPDKPETLASFNLFKDLVTDRFHLYKAQKQSDLSAAESAQEVKAPVKNTETKPSSKKISKEGQ
ncbi:MAG: uroporphyrinogen-III C-methyltransferase [Succinivibrio sp.]